MRAQIVFGGGSDVCWYLDSWFCGALHALRDSLFLTIGAALWGAFSFSLIYWLLRLWRAARVRSAEEQRELTPPLAARRHARRFGVGARHWSGIAATVWLVLLVAPVPLLRGVIAPCRECFDFEAASVHEVGHALGLGHPNGGGANVYQRALAAGLPLNASECLNPWRGVRQGDPAPPPPPPVRDYGTHSSLVLDSGTPPGAAIDAEASCEPGGWSAGGRGSPSLLTAPRLTRRAARRRERARGRARERASRSRARRGSAAGRRRAAAACGRA